MSERCELCRFWQLSSYNGGKIGDQYNGVGGPHTDGSASNCRRHAPRHLQQLDRIYGRVDWPTTKRDEWCGEFEARPTSAPQPGEEGRE